MVSLNLKITAFPQLHVILEIKVLGDTNRWLEPQVILVTPFATSRLFENSMIIEQICYKVHHHLFLPNFISNLNLHLNHKRDLLASMAQPIWNRQYEFII